MIYDLRFTMGRVAMLVAQIGNLLFRRMAFCERGKKRTHPVDSKVCRLPIGDTAGCQPALPGRNVSGQNLSSEFAPVSRFAFRPPHCQ
jgi:hypothetical protein